MFSFRKTCKSVRLKKKKVTTVSAMSENDVQNRIHFWNIKAHGMNSVPARQFPSEWHHLFLMQWTQEWPQALRSWLKKNHWSPWLKYSYRRTRHECDSCSQSFDPDGPFLHNPSSPRNQAGWMWRLPPFSSLIGSLPRRRQGFEKTKEEQFFNIQLLGQLKVHLWRVTLHCYHGY